MENKELLSKTYYQINKKRILAYQKANKEKINTRRKLYRKNNKEKIAAYSRSYYKTHKKKHNTYSRIYMKQRYQIDAQFRLTQNIKRVIRASLNHNKKGAHWEDLVGYTIEKLKKHLERHFVNGMTWDNYGEWHIDHKLPLSVFNFTKPEHEDFKRCWALKNLQPMWAIENLKKQAKIIKHFQPSLLM